MRLAKAEILDDGAVVRLAWRDGRVARFHALWLRDNLPDGRDAGNGQRLFSQRDMPDAVQIETAAIGAEGLTVSFAPEHKTARFCGQWLAAHIYDSAPAPKPPGWSAAALNIWDCELDLNKVTAAYDQLVADEAALYHWLDAVYRYGFGCLTGGPVESGALLKIVDLFGYVRETNYGRWFEVRSEVNPTNLAYTGLGLQPHTDNPYRDPAPTLQILYCLENSATGGDNQLVDGFHVAQRLQADHPDDFEVLSRYNLRFDYAGAADVHLQSRRPLLELSPDGELIAVRFNNRSIAPITEVPFDIMPAFYAAYRRFSAMLDDPAMAVQLKLAPGDSFIVDNTRVLHGRTGFTAEAGSRWLQGCYADKDGLLSKRAILAAAAMYAADAG